MKSRSVFPTSDCTSLLSPSLLSECETLHLRVVALLCHYCPSGEENCNNNGRKQPGGDAAVVLDRLLDLLDTEEHGFELDRAFHLQLARTTPCVAFCQSCTNPCPHWAVRDSLLTFLT